MTDQTTKRNGPPKGSPQRGGRPKGSANVRTREIADKAAASGITPLEVMLEAMNEARLLGEMAKAATYANMAAPYIHPRLSAVTSTAQVTGTMQVQLVDEFQDDEPLA